MVAMLGGMLATTTIHQEEGLEKLRKARNIIVPSYFVLALLSVLCCFTGYDSRIEPVSTLFVASYQKHPSDTLSLPPKMPLGVSLWHPHIYYKQCAM